MMEYASVLWYDDTMCDESLDTRRFWVGSSLESFAREFSLSMWNFEF